MEREKRGPEKAIEAFLFLAYDAEDARCWLNDHLITGVRLRVTQDWATIEEGVLFLLLGEDVGDGTYKVWAVYMGERVSRDGEQVVKASAMEPVWKESWREDLERFDVEDPPIPEKIEDLRSRQWELGAIL